MTDEEEKAYERGHRMAFSSLLGTCLRELYGEGFELECAASELDQARNAARRLCEEHGIEWTEGLHLADVIEKRIGRNMGG